MTAARFRSVYWVAVAAVPALGCYLVTQSVAQDRAALAKVERDIRASRIAIRDLETELGTRASMPQIERWNAESLALAAPTAGQFLASDVQLANLNEPPAPAAPAEPQVRQASASPSPQRQAEPAAEPLLRQATYIKPARDRMALGAQKVALDADGPLNSDVLADLGRIASTERGRAAKENQ